MRTGTRTGTQLRSIAFAAIAAVVVAACGTTVPRSEVAPEDGSDELGNLSTGGLPAGAHVNKKGQVVNAQGEVIGSAEDFGLSGGSGTAARRSVARGPETAPAASDGGADASVSASAPGVTATKLYIGAYYVKNQGAANRALGAGNLDEGDRRKAYNVMIRWVNSRGGVAGRQVVPVYYGVDAQSSQTANQQEQAACSKWTEDNEVFVIFASGPVVDQCAANAGVVEVEGSRTGGASVPDTYRRYPQRIDLATINMVRMGFVTVDGLFKHGYFDEGAKIGDAGAKIGIVTWDDPEYRVGLKEGYVQALERHDLSVADEYYVAVPQTLHDFGETSAAVSNAVFRFKSEGIDHVMILDGPAGGCGGFCITLEWMQNAQSQRYFPRYGLNTTNSPRAGYEEGYIPRDQVRRSIGVVWNDTTREDDEGWHLNRRRELCSKIMRKNGIEMDNPNAEGAALESCNNLWFLQETADRIRGALSVNSFITAANGWRYGFDSTLSYSTYFSPARHDGVGGARAIRFVDACNCFRFITRPYRV